MGRLKSFVLAPSETADLPTFRRVIGLMANASRPQHLQSSRFAKMAFRFGRDCSLPARADR